MSTYTTEQIKKISRVMKSHLANKVFSCEGGTLNRFQYKVVPIVSRDKYNRHFHFKVVVTRYERSIIMRGDNGWLKDENGQYIREWRKCGSSKTASHRHNYLFRREVSKLSLLNVFGLKFWDFDSNTIKVQWLLDN